MLIKRDKTCGGWRLFLWCLPVSLIVSRLLSGQLRPDFTVEEFHKEGKNKIDRLVLGPAAGQGLPNRLHCQGVKALKRTRSLSSRRHEKAGEETTFVTVYTVYSTSLDVRENGGSSDRVVVGQSSYDKVKRSMAILTVIFNFIQKKSIRPSYLRLRFSNVIGFLILDEELKKISQDHIGNYIFNDSDIAVVDHLSSVFHDFQDFHISLIFRNNKNEPLNSGFIVVRGTHEGINRARMFLQEVLELYISKYSSASRRLGDQLALAWAVTFHASFNVKRFAKPQAFIEKIGGTSVLFLPCAWTPPKGAGQFHGMPLDVKATSIYLRGTLKVVHFKGSRKRLILESWN